MSVRVVPTTERPALGGRVIPVVDSRVGLHAAFAVGVVLAVLGSTWKIEYGGHSALNTVATTTATALFLLGGLLIGTLRPDNRSGMLMVLVGAALATEDLQECPYQLLLPLLIPLHAASNGPLSHLMLAFPHGRLGSRTRRALVAAAYLTTAWSAAISVLILGSDRYPSFMPLLPAHTDLYRPLDVAGTVAQAALAAVSLVVLAAQWLRETTAVRRALGPVLLCAALGSVITVLAPVPGPFNLALNGGFVLCTVLWPALFVLGVLRVEWRGVVAQAVVGERRRIERDLHDGAQLSLVNAAVVLDLTAERLAEAGDHASARLVRESTASVREAIALMRDFSRGVPSTYSSDLAEALRGLARRSPITVHVVGDALPQLPTDVALAAYLLVSEALTNVAKHAAVDRASVMYAHSGQSLVVAIRDEGAGCRGPAPTSLAERARSAGGRLSFRSAPGQGTTVSAEFPTPF